MPGDDHRGVAAAVGRVRNAAVRAVRDLRFVLVDRYRALLESRFVALAALAAAVLDGALTAVASARRPPARARRRGATPARFVVLDAVVAAGGQLSVVARGTVSATPTLALRRGDRAVGLETVADTVADTAGDVVRLVGVLPDAVADGAPWTVLIDDAGTPAELGVDHATPLTAPLAVTAGRLTVTPDVPAAGIAHDLRVGIRTMVVDWAAPGAEASLRLTVDGEAPDVTLAAEVTGGRARSQVPLAALGAGSWSVLASGPAESAPLALPRDAYPRLDRFAAAHRVALRADAAGPARVVEVGYADGNRLTVRVRPVGRAS